VAQLGARFHGMEEVIGSIPIRSTNNPIKMNRFQSGTSSFRRGEGAEPSNPVQAVKVHYLCAHSHW
jgi:hypothetical protein